MSRRTFAPTVLVGTAATVLAAVAATRTWVRIEGAQAGFRPLEPFTGGEGAPLVSALSLVALASWGAVLVLRGRAARRVVALLGVVSASGALVALVTAWGAVVDRALADLPDASAEASRSPWMVLCGVGLVVTAGALLVAVRDAPGWPAMGARYDAPRASGAASPTHTAGEADTPATTGETSPMEGADETALWKALDEGRDPTV